jgi:hypothetical protein
MSIYHNLVAMTELAVHLAKEHQCNYNVIISNPVDGKFELGKSTYEMVADSYFKKERPNALLVSKTDDLIAKLEVELNENTLDIKFAKIDAENFKSSHYLTRDYLPDLVEPLRVKVYGQYNNKNTSRKHKQRYF